MKVLLLVAVAWAGLRWDDPVPPPECWRPAARRPVLLGQEVGGAEPIGARSYLGVSVVEPEFVETASGLWLGDVGQLSWYDPDTDRFVSVWKSGEPPGPFAFIGERYLRASREAPREPSGLVRLGLVDLDVPGSGTMSTLTLDLRGPMKELLGRQEEVVLVGLQAGPSPSQVWLALEFPASRDTRAAVLRLELNGPSVQVREAFALGWTFQDLQVFGTPGSPRLALIDDGEGLATWTPAGGLVYSELEGITASSTWPTERGRGLLLGTVDGCVLHIDPNGAGPEVWCDAELASAPIERLDPLGDGRLFVAASAAHQPDPEAVRALYLVREPQGWESRPLPIAEALARGAPDDLGGWPDFVGVRADRSGRTWAAVRRPEGGLPTLQRLDLPFEPLPALLDRQVRALAPLDGEAVALVEDDAGRPSLLRVGRGPLPLPDGMLPLAMAGGEALFVAALDAGGEVALLRWDAASEPPVELDRRAGSSPPFVGLHIAEASVNTTFWELKSLISACMAPPFAPNVLNGVPVCLSAEDHGPRFTAGDLTLVPDGRGGWWRWTVGDATLEHGAERVQLGEPIGPADRPLFLSLGPSPALLVSTPLGIELLDGHGRSPGPAWAGWGSHTELSGCGGTETGTVGALSMFADARGTTWLSARQGAQVRHLRGPLLPPLPELSQTWPLITPTTLILGESADPRALVDVSCDDAGAQPASPGARFVLSLLVAPARRCAVSTWSVHGGWARQGRRTVWAPLGLLLFGLSVAGAAALGTWTAGARSRQARALVGRIAAELENPYIAGPPVTGCYFFGREALLATLIEEVRLGGYVVLAGPKRLGKTSLLLRLRDALVAQGRLGAWEVLPVYVSLERSGGGRRVFQALLRHVLPALRDAAPELELPDTPPADEHEAFEALWSALDQLDLGGRSLRLVLLLDELQLLAGLNASPQALEAAQMLRSLTTEVFRPHLCWVGAGLGDQLQLVEEASDLIAVGPRYALPPMDPKAAQRLVLDPVRELPVRYAADAVDALLEYAQGHPFLLQTACRALLLQLALRVAQEGRVRESVIQREDVLTWTRAHPAASLLTQPVSS